MDLKAKYNDLLQLLINYVSGQTSSNELNLFAWEMIDYFTDTPPDKLPEEAKFEKYFWYAIWQIQHLCDDVHEEDSTTKRELEKALSYMKEEVKMPDECIGQRPRNRKSGIRYS